MLRKFADNRGQSTVEFIMILPFFFMLLLAIVQYSFIFHDYLLLSEATRAGARQATVGKTDSEIITQVSNSVKGGSLTLNRDAVLVSVEREGTNMYDPVTVKVTAPVKALFSALDSLVPTSLTDDVAMQMEVNLGTP